MAQSRVFCTVRQILQGVHGKSRGGRSHPKGSCAKMDEMSSAASKEEGPSTEPKIQRSAHNTAFKWFPQERMNQETYSL